MWASSSTIRTIADVHVDFGSNGGVNGEVNTRVSAVFNGGVTRRSRYIPDEGGKRCLCPVDLLTFEGSCIFTLIMVTGPTEGTGIQYGIEEVRCYDGTLKKVKVARWKVVLDARLVYRDITRDDGLCYGIAAFIMMSDHAIEVETLFPYPHGVSLSYTCGLIHPPTVFAFSELFCRVQERSPDEFTWQGQVLKVLDPDVILRTLKEDFFTNWGGVYDMLETCCLCCGSSK